MSIKWKVSLLLAVTCGLLAGTTYAVQHWIVLPGFVQAERTQARDDLARCAKALKRDCEHLAGLAGDWAAWDETCRYLEERNKEFENANLIPSTYANNRLSLVAIVSSDGVIAWARAFDIETGEYVEAPDLIEKISRPGQRLMSHGHARSGVYGLLTTELGVMLIASRAVVASDFQGPVRGALMMGRLLTDDDMAELSARIHVAVKCWPIEGRAIPVDDRAAIKHLLRRDATWLRDEDPVMLYGYTVIRDVYDRPALLLRADMPRTVRSHGLVAARAATASSLAGGFGILAAAWLLLQRLIVRPLMVVTNHAARVGAEKDLRVHIDLQRNDEIGVLAREFNRMTENLAVYRAQMFEIARRAGMAEVAADVLHNVGNVLNTVNTSATLVTDKLTKSEVPSLALAANMLLEHQDDIGDFLKRNERGRQLPTYLAELAKFLAGEQEAMLNEMQTLTWAVEHVKQVISVQQMHSKTVAVIEEVDPVQVLEEAVQLNLDSFARHDIQLKRELVEVGSVPMDRHKVLQILVNLMSNAKNALKASRDTNRRMTLKLEKVSAGGGDLIRVSVMDNGIGIASENLTRIFAIGFSTRTGGHGIGLHSAANMAKEMGGGLSVASDGPGKGASFTLEFPITRRQVIQ